MTRREARRIIVLGTLASNPYAGMAWMHMQIAEGLRRLGHDVVYVETTSNWPYDPQRQSMVPDDAYAVPYLARVARSFGMGDRWAYRRTYSDGAWVGPASGPGDRLLLEADAVLNVAGSTRLAEDGLEARNLVYFGTDPVYHEITYANGDADTRSIVDEHDAAVTYGENIGTAASPIPPLPNLVGRTRQPVLLDLWRTPAGAPTTYTTVANWKQEGREVVFEGEQYLWSKDVKFERLIDVPRRVPAAIKLATNLAPPDSMVYGEGEPVKARGIEDDARRHLTTNGWRLRDAARLTEDPWDYRDYVESSRGEFGVARDLNVRLRSGWFSERSACYLAAGRPVITQDTGFGTVPPVGEGLFAFSTSDEAVAVIEEVGEDSRGALTGSSPPRGRVLRCRARPGTTPRRPGPVSTHQRADRRLIVNADDFGLSDGSNVGVVRSHTKGIVTSTTMMVRQPSAAAAARIARSLPSLGVGLHTDLGEWEYRAGDWWPRYERVDLDDAAAVEAEVRHQVDAFVELVGRTPTHLDSHQHVHQRPLVADVLRSVAGELAVPVRHLGATRYCGDFYAQTDEGESLPGRITRDALVAILDALGPGTTELACHPAATVDMPGSYREDRMTELETLCDPALPVEIDRRGIVLARYDGVDR